MRSSRLWFLLWADLALAGPSQAASLPTPTLACDQNKGSTTTCDAFTFGSFTITAPTHTVAGDLLIASCQSGDATTIDSLTGFTSFGPPTSIGTIVASQSFYKQATSDPEPASYTLSVTGGTAGNSACYVSAYRGIAQSTPLDVSTNVQTASTSSIVLPSLTTSADNALLWYYCAEDSGTGLSYTPPGGFTEEIDLSITSGWSVQTSAGATGTKTVNLSGTANVLCRYAAFNYNTAGTRIYLPSTGAPAVSPTYDSGWEATGDAARLAAVFTRGSTAMTTVTTNEGTGITTSGQDILARQFSIQVGAQTIGGVLQCNVRSAESNAAYNGRAQLKVWRADSSGSFQDTLLDFQGNTTSGNPTDEFGTTLAARNYSRKGDTHTMTSRTASNNDYVVIEIGSREHNTSSTARTITHRFGDTASTELDRNDAQTTDNYPWCDFLSGLSPPTASSCAAYVSLLGVGCK